MNESARSRDLCKRIEALGAMTYPCIGGMRAPRGWPDRIVVDRGIVAFVEAKMRGGWPNTVQNSVLRSLRERGALVFVNEFYESGGVLWLWTAEPRQGRRIVWSTPRSFLEALHEFADVGTSPRR